ncbi:LOW QUALITY PROTEIN: RNA-directed RNA polymerase L [Frankliniella fusca]|uniref:RNA-directed RNA polymerase L n=1 Tax=Frankliniella fusca TaxID=407009 RepID=A0AAE1L8X8_9NEOP|nr:LOW QUALITY PROTEIN: RNA-directed RNA polymerase L [Frankliniella fusca]
MVLIKLYFLTSLYQHHSSTVKTFASDFSSATTSTPATGLAPRQSQSIKSCPYLSNSQDKTFPTTSRMIKITSLLQPWMQLSVQHNSNNASTFASALNLTPTSATTISTTSKKAEEMMEYCNTSCSPPTLPSSSARRQYQSIKSCPRYKFSSHPNIKQFEESLVYCNPGYSINFSISPIQL